MTGRDALLRAAHDSFAKDGYERVGVARILELAKVQAPTLYHHFGDKEGLYVEWATSALLTTEGRLTPLNDAALPISAALQAIALNLIRLDFDLRQLLFDSERLTRPASREKVLSGYFQAVYSPLYTILSRGQARGEVRSDSLNALAETFVGGALAQHRAGRAADGAQDAAAWWTRLFMEGAAPR